MGGGNMLEQHEKKKDYPWSERLGFPSLPFPLDYYTMIGHDMIAAPICGDGNRWWHPIHKKTSPMKMNDETGGMYWYRRLDHIGERRKRINKMPLSSFVDMERGNYRMDEFKSSYCNHLLAKWAYHQKINNRRHTKEQNYWQNQYISCWYNTEKVANMETERLARLHDAGIFQAIEERDKNRTKFPVKIMYDLVNPQVIDFNRFRDSDNTWESYMKKKAEGEFIKNRQLPDQGTPPMSGVSPAFNESQGRRHPLSGYHDDKKGDLNRTKKE